MKWAVSCMCAYFATCSLLLLWVCYCSPQAAWATAMVLPVLLIITGLFGVWAKAEWTEES